MSRNLVARLTLMVLFLGSGTSTAADKLGRLTLEVNVEGSQSWQSGQDYSNSKISEQYRLVTHVKSDGSPSSINTKDPLYAQNQMAKAASVQQKMREAQARSGKPVPRAAATQEDYLAQQKAIAEEMQKGQAACKGDVNCLMQLAQKFSQQSAMLTYPQPGGAAPGSIDDDEDSSEDERFLSFFGYEGCPGEIHIRINNTAEGATADVAGMIPFKQIDTADYRGTELNRKMQCLGSNLVYDIKTRKIYTDGISHPTPRGTYRYWDRLQGETLNKDTDITTSAAAWDWVFKNLRIADASGSASTTLPAGSKPLVGATRSATKVSGQIKVNMTWTFEPLSSTRTESP
jgi:hypothetical protein